MIRIVRTNSGNSEFIGLVAKLDRMLAETDGRDHEFYNQFNRIDTIEHAIVAYFNKIAVGCGAIKKFDEQSMEVKRMFTLESHRAKGVATAILTELEKWTAELGYSKCVLETGKRLPDAVRLYQKKGYRQIPNYGQYVGMENSVCFEKRLR